jgi:hypothetical protein
MTPLARVVEWIARVRAADALPDCLTYRGFLSYNRADRRQAKWLDRRLERYRVPWLVGARGSHGAIPRRLSPVFRDRENAQAAARRPSDAAPRLRWSRRGAAITAPALASGGR